MSKLVLGLLTERFGEAILETHSHLGDDTAVVDSASWYEVARFLRTDNRCSFDMFIDLTAVDYPDRDPRFEVVCHLRSVDRGHRIRIKSRIGDPDGESAEIDSIVQIWRGANWFERETFDMFGIVFRGHPDLRRILMYPEFKGAPLRKDYPANRIQPLIEFRKGNYEKLPPFGPDEGMSFGRQTHEYLRDDPEMVKARELTEKKSKKTLPARGEG
jgi:NADH-quinone oxidoreductase subunit C